MRFYLSLSLCVCECASLSTFFGTFFLLFYDIFFVWKFDIHTFSNFVSVSDSEQLSMFTVVATPNDALGKTHVVGVVGLIRSNLSSLSLRGMSNVCVRVRK